MALAHPCPGAKLSERRPNGAVGVCHRLNHQITGAASLAGQAAIDRIRAETGALQKSAQSVNLSV